MPWRAADGRGPGWLTVVTIWQSKAHQERFAAEQLFPAFQELGMADDVTASSEFTTDEADELFIR